MFSPLYYFLGEIIDSVTLFGIPVTSYTLINFTFKIVQQYSNTSLKLLHGATNFAELVLNDIHIFFDAYQRFHLVNLPSNSPSDSLTIFHQMWEMKVFPFSVHCLCLNTPCGASKNSKQLPSICLQWILNLLFSNKFATFQ